MNIFLIINMRFLITVLLVGSLYNCSEKESSKIDSGQTSKFQNDSTSFYDSLTTVMSFSVQVAAFKIEENANRIKSHLRKSNFPAYIDSTSTASNELLHRIRLGPFYTMETADSILSCIKKIGYSEAFILTNDAEQDLIDSINVVNNVTDTTDINKKQLTFNDGCSYPQWSPNGREIAFYKNSNRINGVYAIGTGGGHISIIIEGSENREIIPKFSWSPSGDKIAFVAKEINKNWDLVENLYQINKDGSGLKRIVNQEGFSFEISNIKWSPDGQKVAFNAKYGGRETWTTRIQRVLIASINKSASNSPDETGNTKLQNITDPSLLEKTNWLIGWRTNNELLFFSAVDESDYDLDTAYEISSFDFHSQQSKKILSGPFVKEFRMIELFPDEDKIVFAHDSKIIIFDLESGEKTIIFDSEVNEKRPDVVTNPRLNQFYVLSGDQFWIGDLTGIIATFIVPFESKNFTISPGGTQICFEEDGNLFKFKVSNMNKKARH